MGSTTGKLVFASVFQAGRVHPATSGPTGSWPSPSQEGSPPLSQCLGCWSSSAAGEGNVASLHNSSGRSLPGFRTLHSTDHLQSRNTTQQNRRNLILAGSSQASLAEPTRLTAVNTARFARCPSPGRKLATLADSAQSRTARSAR